MKKLKTKVHDFQDLTSKVSLVAEQLKLLSHPSRLKILCALAEQELTVSELVDVSQDSQPLVSQFLLRMKEEKILVSRREQNRIYYSISDLRVMQLIRSLKEIYCD